MSMDRLRELVEKWRAWSKGPIYETGDEVLTHCAQQLDAVLAAAREVPKPPLILNAYGRRCYDAGRQAAARETPGATWQRVTRLEVIDEGGRVYSRWDCRIEPSFQDQGRTLKVFVYPAQPAQETP